MMANVSLIVALGVAAPSPAGAEAATAHPAASQANLHAAQLEARRLLLLAHLPPGATRTSYVAPALAGGPVMGRPAVTSLLVGTQFWRVAVPFSEVSAWLPRHPPKGLRPDGSMNGGAPSVGSVSAGYGYVDQPTPQWESAELEIGAAPLAGTGTTSSLRVDAVVVWNDTRPLPDNAPGPRARVTVAGGCPASDAGLVGVTNPGAHLTTSLLPSGQPTAALVCSYTGLDGPSGTLPAAKRFRLSHHALLGPAAARRLAASLAALPLSHPGGTMFCPLSTGAAEIISFSYPRRADVDIWEALTGCPSVANGYITAG